MKMIVHDDMYTILRKIQFMEEKSSLLSKIEQKFYSKLSELQENPSNVTEKEIQNIYRVAGQMYELREDYMMHFQL